MRMRAVARVRQNISLLSPVSKGFVKSAPNTHWSFATMANIHTPIPNLKLNDGHSIPMVSLRVQLIQYLRSNKCEAGLRYRYSMVQVRG